jgi:signal transduction histidine kinase
MLAAILGNAEMALDDLGDDGGPKRNVEQIVKASKRARDLVREILTFSRKTEHRRKPLRLAPLVRETFTLLRGSLPSTIHMKLRVRATSDTVLGDPSQIQQVLMNLSTNAAHAMGDNGGTLSIGLTDVVFHDHDQTPEDLEPGNYLKLSVRDTGAGMTKEIQKRIFEPFFTTKSHEGTGMGLAVVYGIVKNHKGTITVESSPGRGSTFHVFFPYQNVSTDEQLQEAGRVHGGKERILLVDDEPSEVEMPFMILQRLGYTVTTAENGTRHRISSSRIVTM